MILCLKKRIYIYGHTYAFVTYMQVKQQTDFFM